MKELKTKKTGGTPAEHVANIVRITLSMAQGDFKKAIEFLERDIQRWDDSVQKKLTTETNRKKHVPFLEEAIKSLRAQQRANSM